MTDESERPKEPAAEPSETNQLRAELARLTRTVDGLQREVRRLVRVTARATAQRQVEQTDSIVTVHRLDTGGMEIRVRDTAEQTQVTRQALEAALVKSEEDWLGGYDH